MSTDSELKLPDAETLQNAVRLAVVEDRPVMLDYWVDSIKQDALIGVRENGEKLLVKNKDEYTSCISKIFKVKTDYIILTENSIYIVDTAIPTRRIS